MRIYRFSPEAGREIKDYDSQGARLSLILGAGEVLRIAYVGRLHLEPHGAIGRHPAKMDQLLLIVGGDAIVTGADSAPVQVSTGTAVFWQAGESHETRAGEIGLAAIVLEGENLYRE